jgi:hypothetical protein
MFQTSLSGVELLGIPRRLGASMAADCNSKGMLRKDFVNLRFLPVMSGVNTYPPFSTQN